MITIHFKQPIGIIISWNLTNEHYWNVTKAINLQWGLLHGHTTYIIIFSRRRCQETSGVWGVVVRWFWEESLSIFLPQRLMKRLCAFVFNDAELLEAALVAVIDSHAVHVSEWVCLQSLRVWLCMCGGFVLSKWLVVGYSIGVKCIIINNLIIVRSCITINHLMC